LCCVLSYDAEIIKRSLERDGIEGETPVWISFYSKRNFFFGTQHKIAIWGRFVESGCLIVQP
jgi:hypothetical protein